MLNKKNNKEHKLNGQEPDQRSSLRLRYSSELKMICQTSEAGKIVNSADQAPLVILDDDNCCI